jgi:hypothetical protein
MMTMLSGGGMIESITIMMIQDLDRDRRVAEWKKVGGGRVIHYDDALTHHTKARVGSFENASAERQAALVGCWLLLLDVGSLLLLLFCLSLRESLRRPHTTVGVDTSPR